MDPLISIIITNFNGKKWLEKCFTSLLNQTYINFEIIFIDNKSVDDSVEYLENNFSDSRIKIIKSEINTGFSGWNNLWISNAKGEYILLLNNDIWVKNDFLKKLIDYKKTTNLDIIGPSEMDYNWNELKNIQYWIDLFWHVIFYKTLLSEKLFYLQGHSIFMKTTLYREVWWLDNDFFMYVEEVDFFWRAILLKNIKIWIAKDMPIYHAWAWSTWNWIKYNVFLWRNQNTLQMLLKNYYWFNLVWIIPIYLGINLAEILAFMIFWKWKIAFSYVEGWIYNIKIFPKTLKKRQYIQKNRIIPDREIMKKMYFWFGKLKHLIDYFK